MEIVLCAEFWYVNFLIFANSFSFYQDMKTQSEHM